MLPSSARRLIFLFGAVLVADQVTKFMALSTLAIGVPVPVIGDWLRWTLTYNPGGAFGVRLGTSLYYLLSSFLIFAILIFYIWHHRNIAHIAIPLTIVAGGAAGNIIDRLRFGEVVDFIDCEFPDISLGSYQMDRWPIFNIADMAVSCGIIAAILLMMIHSYRERRRLQSEPQMQPDPHAAPQDGAERSSQPQSQSGASFPDSPPSPEPDKSHPSPPSAE